MGTGCSNGYLWNEKDDILISQRFIIDDLYDTLLDSISNPQFKNKEILILEKIKYDFFKGISHELKKPLASLKIILEKMKYNVGKSKNRDVYIDDCIDLVDHLTKNIQQI